MVVSCYRLYSNHKYHLTSLDFVSADLILYKLYGRRSDPVRRGCDQLQCTALSLDEMSVEMRSDEMK